MKQLPVKIVPRVREEIESAHQWWAENRSSEQANRWERGLEKAIMGLGKTYPQHSMAPENPKFPFEVRQLLFGLGRRPTHRVLFTIAANEVSVLAVRHVSQSELGPDDLP
jgi:plasmid stabilization system protein ParE